VSFQSLVKTSSVQDAERQKSDDALFNQAADWLIPGDGKAGGTATITRKGNETTAEGKTADGIDYKVQSTPEKQQAKVGAFDVTNTKDGGKTVSNDDFTTTVKPPITTLEAKDGSKKITYNSQTHEYTLIDYKIGYSIYRDAKGTVKTTVGENELEQVGAGGVPGALKTQLPPGVKFRFAIDKDGNRGAFAEDGTVYELMAKTHQLIVEKDGFKMILDTVSSKAQLFKMDEKTHKYVLTKPDPATMPKGWVIDGDSVIINGQKVKNKGEHVVHVLSAVFSLDGKTITLNSKNGPIVMAATGTDTSVSGANLPKVNVNPTGTVSIAETGKPPIVIDPVKGASMEAPDGSVASIAPDGAAKIVDGKTHQEADTSCSGDLSIYNAQHHQMFSMNSQGDVRLADNTLISHTGLVSNTSRNIMEPAYNGKTASQVVQEAAIQAASLGSFIGGGVETSIAALESTLALLDSLGDVPGLAEQIGTAKADIEAKLAQAKDKEYLTSQLSHAGKNDGAIEKAFAMRGSGLSDQDIAEKITRPKNSQADSPKAA
jgi:hypothetical protein